MGFLGRVASRGVGEATAARPRLADPFGPREAVAPVGLEMLDLEAAPVSGPTRRVEAVAATAGVPPSERGGEPPELEVPSFLPRGPEVARPPWVTPAKAAAPAAASRSENERHDVVPRPRRGTTEPPSAAQVENEPVAAAPLARATPVAPAPVASAAAAVLPVAAEQQPAVRVHIGRLEVRANLEQPLKQPQQRRESRRSELTLSDYLRGRQAR